MSGWAAAAQAGAELGQMWYEDYQQRRANKWNVQLARENRDWQEKMANTQYQRAAKDMEAAGLNRILALGGPAATPAGNVASVEPTRFSKGFNAMNIASAKQAIDNAEAQEELIRANTRIANAEADKSEVTKKLYDAALPYVNKFFDEQLPGLIDGLNSGKSMGEKYERGIGVIGDMINRKFEELSNSAKDIKDKAASSLDDWIDLKELKLRDPDEKAREKEIRDYYKNKSYYDIKKDYRNYVED